MLWSPDLPKLRWPYTPSTGCGRALRVGWASECWKRLWMSNTLSKNPKCYWSSRERIELCWWLSLSFPESVSQSLIYWGWVGGWGTGTWHPKKPHPKTWNTPFPLFWGLEEWNGSLSINSPKTNLWGRWCQSRGFCRGSVGEPICQYCSCCFSNAFTNW